ncbi:CapA family protein, partial [Senegalia massiliensis]
MKKVLLTLFIIIFTVTITVSCSDLDNSEKLEQNESKNQEQDENNIVEEEIEKYSELSLSATGDIMFHGAQLKSAYNNNTKEYDFKRVFENVKPHLENSDIAISNFETTTAGSEMPISSYPSFNSPDSTVDALKYSGIDILTTANNHSLDTGKIGIVNTIKNIENNGIDYIGTSEEEYRAFILKEKNDITLSFLSYTYGLNGNDSRLNSNELDNMVNLIDEDKMQEDIKKAKNVSDKVVVFIHWG